MTKIQKALSILLSAVLLAAMFSGVGFAEEAESQSSSVIYEAAGVDELLAAIGSDRTVVLTGSEYLLSSASDYGNSCGTSCYYWNEVYDGFELKISGVSNLKIISECGSSITVEPRYAAVLRFCDCDGIELRGITAGHTVEPGFCDAGVIAFDGCRNCLISSSSLYGCGSIGVNAVSCEDINITDSEVYSCSLYAFYLDRCRNAEIASCRIHDFKDAECLFSLSSCSSVMIKQCDIFDCSVYSLISPGYSNGVYFTANSVKNCSFLAPVFDLDREIVVDGCEFINCGQVFWYKGEARAKDGSGKQLRKADLSAMTLAEPLSPAVEPTSSPAQSDGSGCYYAETVDEFLAAIGPNRTIVLTAQHYDLSEASLYGAYGSEYYYWFDDFDGPGLVIQNADNLTIRSSDGNAMLHCISAVPRYADVIEFVNCIGLSLEGITLGHTQEPGYCSGGVISLQDCEDCRFYKCRMYGCGILGIDASGCSRLNVDSCDIFDCSQGGVWLYGCSNSRFENCSYSDLGGPAFSLAECKDTYIENTAVSNGYFNVNEKGPIALGYEW